MMKTIKTFYKEIEFKVEKTAYNGEGHKRYSILHNMNQLGKTSGELIEAYKELRTMQLEPIAKIREIFDKAMKGIPEEFELKDVMEEATDVDLANFRSAMTEPRAGNQERYDVLFTLPPVIPSWLQEVQKYWDGQIRK